jgi:hypothetical protein
LAFTSGRSAANYFDANREIGGPMGGFDRPGRAWTPFLFRRNTSATGNYCTAFGYGSVASGSFSLLAIGDHTTAFGCLTTGSGNYSTAFGYGSQADANFSTAFGYGSKADANLSTASGYDTVAEPQCSFVIGRYNLGAAIVSSTSTSPTTWIATDPIFEIGIGTSSSNAADAFVVYKNGNTYASGN